MVIGRRSPDWTSAYIWSMTLSDWAFSQSGGNSDVSTACQSGSESIQKKTGMPLWLVATDVGTPSDRRQALTADNSDIVGWRAAFSMSRYADGPRDVSRQLVSAGEATLMMLAMKA